MAGRFDPHTSNALWPRASASDPDYRKLAICVLHRALLDALAGDDEARVFLAGGPLLELWTALAGLNLRAVVERSATAIARARHPRDRSAA